MLVDHAGRIATLAILALAIGCGSSPTEPAREARTAPQLAKPNHDLVVTDNAVPDATYCSFCGTTGTGKWLTGKEQALYRCAIYDTNAECQQALFILGAAAFKLYRSCIAAAAVKFSPLNWIDCGISAGMTAQAAIRWDETPGNYSGVPLKYPHEADPARNRR